MYRDDDAARAERAGSLIDEIAALERQRLAHAATDQRLADAKRELSALRDPEPAAVAPPPRSPGVFAHAAVFAATAGAAYLGYTLLI